jgi:hypothetical protein
VSGRWETSTSRHSWHVRRLQDLPIQGVPAALELRSGAGNVTTSNACERPPPKSWRSPAVCPKYRRQLLDGTCIRACLPPVRLAQQTVTVPPVPPSLPSIQPQFQAFTGCVMNCDTAAGMCQGGCSVNNTPATLAATPAPGIRPDPNALSQCYLSCTGQQLVCKQACTPP